MAVLLLIMGSYNIRIKAIQPELALTFRFLRKAVLLAILCLASMLVGPPYTKRYTAATK